MKIKDSGASCSWRSVIFKASPYKAMLNVGKSTIRKHMESIFHKLGVQSRTEAIAYALGKLGMLKALPLI